MIIFNTNTPHCRFVRHRPCHTERSAKREMIVKGGRPSISLLETKIKAARVFELGRDGDLSGAWPVNLAQL